MRDFEHNRKWLEKILVVDPLPQGAYGYYDCCEIGKDQHKYSPVVIARDGEIVTWHDPSSWVKVPTDEYSIDEFCQLTIKALIASAESVDHVIKWGHKQKLRYFGFNYVRDSMGVDDLPFGYIISNEKRKIIDGFKNVFIDSALLNDKYICCTESCYIGVIPVDWDFGGSIDPGLSRRGVGIINPTGL